MVDINEQPQEVPAIVLAPLSIPCRTIDKSGVSRYSVYGSGGEYELVEAFSAADVPAKTTITNIKRIQRETRHVMQSIPKERVVTPEEPSFKETNVDPEREEVAKFITIDLTEVADSKKAEFEGLTLGQLHPMKEAEVTIEADDVPEVLAIETEAAVSQEAVAEVAKVSAVADVAEVAVTEPEVEEPKKAAPIPKERIEEPENDLAQDEIEALLNNSDD